MANVCLPYNHIVAWCSFTLQSHCCLVLVYVLSVRAIRIMTIRFGKKTCNLRQLLATHKQKEREHTKKEMKCTYNVRCDIIEWHTTGLQLHTKRKNTKQEMKCITMSNVWSIILAVLQLHTKKEREK